jgi:hypothetical protein
MRYAMAWSTGIASYFPPLACIRSLRIDLRDLPPTYSITM